jgi:hypothetical protein
MRKILILLTFISCDKSYYSDDFIPDEQYSRDLEISIVDISNSNLDSLEFLLDFIHEAKVELIIINDLSAAEKIMGLHDYNHSIYIPHFYVSQVNDSGNTPRNNLYKAVKTECDEELIGFLKRQIKFKNGQNENHPAVDGFLRLYPNKIDDIFQSDDFMKIDFHYGILDIIVATSSDVLLMYDFREVVVISNLENEKSIYTPYECYYYNNHPTTDMNHYLVKSSHVLVNSIYTLIEKFVPEEPKKNDFQITSARNELAW